MEKVINEIHAPARRNFARRKVKMRRPFETLQADLVEMGNYSRENKNYRYLLTVIDIFSKFAWAVPVKTKNGKDVTNAMDTVLKKIKSQVYNLHVDQGKEFYNQHFQNLMNKYNINMYSTFSGLKASICERFNRTIKSNM